MTTWCRESSQPTPGDDEDEAPELVRRIVDARACAAPTLPLVPRWVFDLGRMPIPPERKSAR